MKIEYKSKDENWQKDGSTVYWFELTGEDYGTGLSFDGDVYGLVEGGRGFDIVDCDGYPIEGNGYEEVAVRNALENAVTDEMRAE